MKVRLKERAMVWGELYSTITINLCLRGTGTVYLLAIYLKNGL